MSSGFVPEPPLPCHPPVLNQPAWDIALLYPMQGQWSQEEYLTLTDNSRWLIEYTAGRIEVLAIPTIEHQRISRFLFRLLDAFSMRTGLGETFFCPVRVYFAPDKYREPDIVFASAARNAQSGNRYYEGADLVIEIVSEDANLKKRDHVQKVEDYALGGVSEYWIVDPQTSRITVLTLRDGSYQQHGLFCPGQVADSPLLPGFTVDVAAAFSAAQP